VRVLKEVDGFEFYEISAHFSPGLSREIKTYAEEEVFKGSRYIFTRRIGRDQYGYCTYCKKESKVNGYKHNSQRVCPECHHISTVKGSGMGRSKMVDKAYFIYYEKSLVEPKTIVARGIYAVRDYRGDYRKVITFYKVIALYVFRMHESVMLKRYFYYSLKGKIEAGQYQKTAQIYSLVCKDSLAYIHSDYSRESIAAAVKGTPFQYSTWEQYDFLDMTTFFNLYAKYPCIEYLTKLGFGDLVSAKLEGRPTLGAVNWNGKDLFKVLRVNKQEFNEIKKRKITVDFYFLKILQISKREHWGLSLSEMVEFVKKYSSYYFNDLQKVAMHSSIKKVIGYMDKQLANDSKLKKGKHFYGFDYIVTTYRDYLNDCVHLELDLTHERVLFPKNLYNAHQKSIKQRKLQADELTNKKIADRAQSLQKYCFTYHNLLIRPAVSFQELIDEGKALQHCVGTYAEMYADGRTTILFIRKLVKPDKPYFTVEVRNQLVDQVRGFKNCDPDKQVNEFVTAFTKAKLCRNQVNKFGMSA
jgi:hypothetical protein